MKLFHFNPNGFDYQYYVMATNVMIAHECLLKFLLEKNKNADSEFLKFESWEQYIMWKKVYPLDITTIPKSYTIEEHPANEIIEVETN